MISKYDAIEWVEQIQSSGRYTFTRQEFETGTGLTPASAVAALRRLRERGRLASPRRGFHVIVPPEYRVPGSPPASWFVDDFMRHLGQPYYVGLLSAAAIHGAAHQQPMVFQVVTDRPTREATTGKVLIRFTMRRRMARLPVTIVNTETGTMRVAIPELTAFDLVRDSLITGLVSQVATVLAELAERLNGDALAAAADLMRRPDVQRLGYLLDAVGCADKADGLAEWLTGRRPRFVPLWPGGPVDSYDGNRWHILPNVDLDVDL